MSFSIARPLLCLHLLAALAAGSGGCVGVVGSDEGGTQAGTTSPGSGPGPAGGGGAPVGPDGEPVGGGAPTVQVPPPRAEDPLGAGADPGCAAVDPGPAPLRRLTRFEYNNAVRDLLGDATRPADTFPPEEELTGFDNDAASLRVSRVLAEKYFTVAQEVAARATRDLAKLLGCAPVPAGPDACVRGFIQRFGLRAYRRPLEAEEADRLQALYEKARGEEGGPEAGVLRLVQAILMAPSFMYRIESPPREGVALARPYDLASRLSFTLWGSIPDDELLTAAREGRLSSAGDVAVQARRMLADPRTGNQVRHFHALLFELDEAEHLEKDAGAFPGYAKDLGPLFREETERFLAHVVLTGKGVETMLTAPFTFMNGRLASFHGVKGVAGEAWQEVALDPARRAGFITQSSVMAIHAKVDRTEPIFRGLFVRGALFCGSTPSPPPGAEVTMGRPNLTGRERLEEHRRDPGCAGCHRLFDPIGLSFENLDAVGRWRDTENGKPIDATGELVGTDVDGVYDGPVALARKLNQSAMVKRCLVGKWFSYAQGRPAAGADRCSIAGLERAFARSDHRFQDLLVALTQTDAFLYRRASP